MGSDSSKVGSKPLSARDAAKPPRHVQGDFRPLAIAKVAPFAPIKSAEVELIVGDLGLKQARALKLKREIQKIMGSYIGTKLTAKKKMTPGDSLRALRVISNASLNLATKIDSFDPDMLVTVNKARGSVPDGPDDVKEAPHFEFIHLAPTLRRLSIAARKVEADTKANSSGNPGKAMLDVAVAALLTALHAAKLKVTATTSGERQVRNRVGEEGGELLVRLFRALDPSVTESMLKLSIDRVREAADASEPVTAT